MTYIYINSFNWWGKDAAREIDMRPNTQSRTILKKEMRSSLFKEKFEFYLSSWFRVAFAVLSRGVTGMLFKGGIERRFWIKTNIV